MVEAHPLVGVGWGRFQAESAHYFEQNPDFPLTATDEIIHNVFLTYAAETGLIGLGLWLLTLAWAPRRRSDPARARRRGPGRSAAGAFLVFFLDDLQLRVLPGVPEQHALAAGGRGRGRRRHEPPGRAPEAAPEA